MGTRRILVTDVDGTLVGDEPALARFVEWYAAGHEDWRLAYATGRSRESLGRLIDEGGLPRPDAAIVSVGTEVYDRDGRPWPGWDTRFAGWNADGVRRTLARLDRLRPQPPASQTRLKASYFAPDLRPDELAQVRRTLDEHRLEATVVYSSCLNLDVLPAGSGKGQAAWAVAHAFGLDAAAVLVCGDSGNDLQLFEQGFLGTIVANAESELVAAAGSRAYRSPYPYADGVLDGIRHWSDPHTTSQSTPRREAAMLQLTPEATKHLLRVRRERGVDDTAGARFISKGTGIGLTFAATPQPEDHVIAVAEIPVYVAREVGDALDASVIDARVEDGKSVLVVRRSAGSASAADSARER